MVTARLHLHLLGLFRLLRDDRPVAGLDQARLQHLLAYLVLHRAAPISRQQLAFLFWPDSTDRQALKNLRTLLTRLRHALPDLDQLLAVTAQTIQWRPDAPLTLDVAKFEAATAQAAATQAGGDVAAVASALAATVATYRGELLPDCYDDWILPHRERLHQACGDALARSSDQEEAAVVQGLDELWQRQLVRVQGPDAYDFSHDGIRAVAYDEISPIRRRTMHLRVAQALEALHDEDLDSASGQIAAHYEQAGQAQAAIRFYRRAAAAVEASGSEEVAYNVGYVSGREDAAIGVNWNFDPCVDILTDWRNTIVNTRAYGTDADTVLKYTRQYIKGLKQSSGAVCVKHFPGDGTEERDQHLVLGVNEQSLEEWDVSFGKVYKTLIDEGLMSIMAGHIALPEYSYKLVPGLKYEDVLPATPAPELINGLLKTQLDFNGLVTTDASHMLGMAAAMPRRDFVPQAIAAGCDMFLFWRDADEDFGYMLDGYRRGVITEERLTDALRRILGVKAALGLHELQKEGKLTPPEEGLAIVGCAEHLAMPEDAADKCISLVKNTRNELPIRPETHKRIEVHVLKLEEAHGIYKAKAGIEDLIREELERVGFEVTLADGAQRIGGKVEEFKAEFDAVLEFSDVRCYAAEDNYRIKWPAPMGADIPWFVTEKPTVFVSLNFTTHLTDVPMVKCYINAYKNTRAVIRATIQKIMGGSEFKGQHLNEHVWREKWETRR